MGNPMKVDVLNTASVLNEIISIARNYSVQKVVLFGSRARGDNSDVSDYDIAIFENNLTANNKAYFNVDVEENQTIKKIDKVFVNDCISDELMKNIEKEGIVIYEQI